MNNLVSNYLDVVRSNYFNFNGRATRSQFWLFVLANFIVGFVLNLVFGLINAQLGQIVSGLYNLAVLCPCLGVTARRLHDTNRSGWMQLIVLIPLVGYIILLILCAQPSQDEGNRFNA